jgi:hypothetical protein
MARDFKLSECPATSSVVGEPRKEGLIVMREELSGLATREERHRGLFARLLLALSLTIIVFAIGTVLTWVFESFRAELETLDVHRAGHADHPDVRHVGGHAGFAEVSARL